MPKRAVTGILLGSLAEKSCSVLQLDHLACVCSDLVERVEQGDISDMFDDCVSVADATEVYKRRLVSLVSDVKAAVDQWLGVKKAPPDMAPELLCALLACMKDAGYKKKLFVDLPPSTLSTIIQDATLDLVAKCLVKNYRSCFDDFVAELESVENEEDYDDDGTGSEEAFDSEDEDEDDSEDEDEDGDEAEDGDVEVVADGDVEVVADGDVEVVADGNVEVVADGNVEVFLDGTLPDAVV
jgi:hypothetical protein